MAAKNRTHSAKPFSMMADALESAAESFEEATANAPESARRAARVTKRALGVGVFKTFYGISFGLVYSGVFLTELLPEASSVRRALVEGAEAAITSRQKVRKTIKDKPSEPAPKAKAAVKTSGELPARAATRKVVKNRAAKFEAAVEGLDANAA
jgi:hypothetical protein